MRQCADGPGTPLRKLLDLAAAYGFHVTSTCAGFHNRGSLHYRSRAIDVRTRDKSEGQIEAFMHAARAAGIHVRDERVRPAGQKVFSGPHLHLEIPD